MDECNCQTPGDKTKDFIVATAPVRNEFKQVVGHKIAWYARKDCPLHGMKVLSETDAAPVPEKTEAAQ